VPAAFLVTGVPVLQRSAYDARDLDFVGADDRTSSDRTAVETSDKVDITANAGVCTGTWARALLRAHRALQNSLLRVDS